jgi:hypothetical protein
MKNSSYSTTISALASKVFDRMLGLTNKKTYEEWTAEFNPTSTFEGSWNKGSKMYFIGIDENGKRGGMLAEIAENIPNKYISIHHYGMIEGDQEITAGEKVEQWAGSHENYTFEEKNGSTLLSIEIDIVEEYEDFFNETWPKALAKLKEIVEK